jgi:hypothetical protein
MMCAERAHRMIMAIMLGIVMGMMASQSIQIVFLLLLFMMVSLLVWAFADFCLTIFLLKKILPSCDTKKDNN